MHRVAIWSVLEEDQRWYAWLFPGLWLVGTLYHGYLRFQILADENLLITVGEFTKDIGIVGLSAAILALMAIAARRGIMALFDWPSRAKTRAENNREWERWLGRKERAEREGREFNEPSPSQREASAVMARDRYTRGIECSVCDVKGEVRISENDGWAFVRGSKGRTVTRLTDGFSIVSHGVNFGEETEIRHNQCGRVLTFD